MLKSSFSFILTLIILSSFFITTTISINLPRFIYTSKVDKAYMNKYKHIKTFAYINNQRQVLKSFSMSEASSSNITYSNEELAHLSTYVLLQSMERLFYSYDKEFINNLNQDFTLFSILNNKEVIITNPTSSYWISLKIKEEGVEIEFIKEEDVASDYKFLIYEERITLKQVFLYAILLLDRNINEIHSFTEFLSYIHKNFFENVSKSLILNHIINQDPTNMYLEFSNSINAPSIMFSALSFDIAEPTSYSTYPLNKVFKNLKNKDFPINLKDKYDKLVNQVKGFIQSGVFSESNRHEFNIDDFKIERTGWFFPGEKEEYSIEELNKSVVIRARKLARRTFDYFFHDFIEICLLDERKMKEIHVVADLQGYNHVNMQYIRFSLHYVGDYNQESCADFETIQKNENGKYSHYLMNKIIKFGVPFSFDGRSKEKSFVKYVQDVVPKDKEYSFGNVMNETKSFYFKYPFYNFFKGNCQQYATQVLTSMNDKDVNGGDIENTDFISVNLK